MSRLVQLRVEMTSRPGSTLDGGAPRADRRPRISSAGSYHEGVKLDRLPGGDLVAKGLRDLAAGVESEEALLTAIGAARLRGAGIDVPPDADAIAFPEHRLYAALEARHEGAAHGRYNALIRRLVSFERAAEHAAPR